MEEKRTRPQTPGEEVPPIGAAPEGQDFAHPWIITAIISVLSFGIGFGALHLTGLWGWIWPWADGPFLIYLAILLPVIVGFLVYGLVTAARLALGQDPQSRKRHKGG